ncbi:MAG TPA: HEAT repeat domain-containing protein, partial [Gemmataceae bacterium]
MRKKGSFWWCCLLLVLASRACPAGDPKGDEPQYKGKSLSAWLTALDDKDAKVRVQAVEAIQSFGPRAKVAIPRLISMLKDAEENIPHFVGDALRAMGTEAIPALIEATKSKEDGFDGMALRTGALGVLDLIKPKEQTALSAIRQATRHKDPFTRRAAIGVFKSITDSSEESLIVTIRALRDEDQQVAVGAACLLTYFGPEACKALPELDRMLKSKDRERRRWAMIALGHVASKNGRKFRDVTPALIRAWKDEDSNVRYGAVKMLGTVRAPAKDAVPILLEALKDPNKDMQVAAKESLWLIDPERVEQFRLTSPVGRIKDPQKQAEAALLLLLESRDYAKELRWLPKQLRHTLSPTARKYLTGILLANLTSRRELQLENIAPTAIISRVA